MLLGLALFLAVLATFWPSVNTHWSIALTCLALAGSENLLGIKSQVKVEMG